MSDNHAAFLNILAEDKFSISYRPRFAALTDSALSAILLQQVIHWWKVKDNTPFYKFRAPCSHSKYQENQSWCEELAWNKYEFDNALKVIATKITKGVKKQDILNTDIPKRAEGESDQDFAVRLAAALKCMVIYWTDSSRITWYQVNENLLGKFVGQIYLDKSYGLRYLEKPKVKLTQENQRVRFTSSSKITKDKPHTLAPVGGRALRNSWYEAVKDVWGFTESRNTIMAQMLQGTAKQKGYKEFNLTVPITPDELLMWGQWYRKTELKGDKKLNMLEQPMKVQSSIAQWQGLGKPTVGKQAQIIQLEPEPTDYPSTADYVNLAGGA